jgi:hypothetical protein
VVRNQQPLAVPATASANWHWSWHSVAVSVPRLPPTAVPAHAVAVLVVVHSTTGTNDAVTMVSAVTDKVQVAVPVQPPPDQPVKAEPVAGTAVRTTLAVALKSAAQVAPQLMPAGADVTVPVPLPARTIVREFCGGAKVAVTVVAADIVTVQVLVPEQPPPDQPANTDPVAAVAVKTTLAPALKGAAQVAPQVIPAGAEVTDPVPVPALVTVNVFCPLVNVAVTAASPALRLTEQVPVPVQPPPDQPAKVEPVAAVAVRTTGEVVKARLQVVPQLIPLPPG